MPAIHWPPPEAVAHLRCSPVAALEANIEATRSNCLLRATVGQQLLGLAHSVGLRLWSFDFRPCLLATLRAATPPLLSQANLLLVVHVSLQWRAANLVSVEMFLPYPPLCFLNDPACSQSFGPG